MKPGFQSDFFKVVTGDGRHCTLIDDEIYVSLTGDVYVIPKGSTSDGASTPSIIWITIPPFGDYWKEAFLHDAAYRDLLLVVTFPDGKIKSNLDGTTLKRASLTKGQSDDLLKEAMKLAGVNEYTAAKIYEGVHLGGWKSFTDDRKQPEPQVPESSQPIPAPEIEPLP